MTHPVALAFTGVLCLVSGCLAADNAIASLVQPYVDRHVLAGAVMCVGTRDKVVDMETVGFADIESKRPMTADAVFWIASQTKAMTAAAVMMLVDAGKLTLDDPIEKYIPEFKDQMVATNAANPVAHKPARPITLRQVLSHTSGLPFSSPAEQPTLDMLTLAEGVHSYAAGPLVYEPGTKYQYSNAGINTAARIVEIVSGMSYEQFMQTRLFTPLGMKDTTWRPNSEQIGRLAKSYKSNGAKDGLEATSVTQLHYPLDEARRQPMPAGGLFSTASDVMRFCQMLANNGVFEGKRYLSESAVQQMTTRQTPTGLPDSYGLALSVGSNWFGHGGAYATNMKVERDRNLITVWLVQHASYPGDGSKAGDVFQKAAEERFGTHAAE